MQLCNAGALCPAFCISDMSGEFLSCNLCHRKRWCSGLLLPFNQSIHQVRKFVRNLWNLRNDLRCIGRGVKLNYWPSIELFRSFALSGLLSLTFQYFRALNTYDIRYYQYQFYCSNYLPFWNKITFLNCLIILPPDVDVRPQPFFYLFDFDLLTCTICNRSVTFQLSLCLCALGRYATKYVIILLLALLQTL